MKIRAAKIEDIAEIQIVRNSVKENVLSNPDLVTNKDCEEYLTKRGKGWIGEIENKIVGFAIIDLQENVVWALFIQPEFEKKGIGRALHDKMLNWYFEFKEDTLWLETEPHTRAETFYLKSGWTKIGLQEKGDLRFEMTFNNWQKNRKT